MLLFLLLAGAAQHGYAQLLSPSMLEYGRLRFSLNGQGKRSEKTDKNNKYQYSQASLSLSLPLFRRSSGTEASRSIYGAFLSPGLTLGRFDLSDIGQQRMLVNLNATLGGYWFFSEKNMLLGTFRVSENEDEYTIDHPKQRYNYLLLYSRRLSSRWSLTAGGGYSFIFGEGVFFPVLGTRVRIGEQSRLNLILPLSASFTVRVNERLLLSTSLRPDGGINRFNNRFNIPDSTAYNLMLKRRALNLSETLIYRARPDLAFQLGVGFLFGQQLTFSEDDERAGYVYYRANISNALTVRLGLSWKPWYNSLRNKNKPHPARDADEEEEEYLLGL